MDVYIDELDRYISDFRLLLDFAQDLAKYRRKEAHNKRRIAKLYPEYTADDVDSHYRDMCSAWEGRLSRQYELVSLRAEALGAEMPVSLEDLLY